MVELIHTILSNLRHGASGGVRRAPAPLPLASKRSPIEPSSEISAVDVQIGGAEIC